MSDHQFTGTGLVWPARRQHPQHLQLAAGQRSMMPEGWDQARGPAAKARWSRTR